MIRKFDIQRDADPSEVVEAFTAGLTDFGVTVVVEYDEDSGHVVLTRLRHLQQTN